MRASSGPVWTDKIYKNAPRQGLLYKKSGSMVIQGYHDSDWASCKEIQWYLWNPRSKIQ